MHLLHTYMYRVLIERFRLSVYAVQLVCSSNVNTLLGILFSPFLAITIVIACKSYAWY